MTWTQFWDMHSGGGTKEPPYEKIYIEAPKDEAISIFYARFGHNPERVSCTCCGDDYAIDEGTDLAQMTAYHRNCGTAWCFTDDGTEVTDFADLEWGEVVGMRQPDGTRVGGKCEEVDGNPTYQGRVVEERYVERPRWPDIDPVVLSLEEFLAQETTLVIRANEIEDRERTVEVPVEGYVWQG